MDSLFESQDWLYKRLYDAVMEAVVSSESVKQILLDLQSKNMIDSMAVVNLILSLEELADLAYSKSHHNELSKAEYEDAYAAPTIEVG